MSILAKIRSSLAAFKKDEKGVAFVEFTVVMGVIAILLPGVWEVTDALMVKRKVNQAATVLADLTAQAATIDQTAYDSMAFMTNEIMHPYENFETRLGVIGVRVDANRRVSTIWTYGDIDLDDSSLPSALVLANRFYVMSAAEVDYQPIFGESVIGTITMRNTAIMSPRLSSSVEEK
ncbi:TadE/TadG family type IV pilus assembly protein [Cohaesibacter celericrescens]|uniref:Pilus assembly protein n=1 Tax=Cohaesibacter celericrescens TaxID=2067669 RepID=A0A2N5XMQ8_9HYPH|nr:TadE/TadG family type IV pilus assembly protein [Cohaesibacter celericrescens]PLW75836.1 hypothetical protein C0081_17180 [Cohaesibacter celericrescens]